MCRRNFAFLCYGFFLLVTSSSKSQQNSTNQVRNDNLTIQYEDDTDSTSIYSEEMKTLRYDLYEKLANNMQYNEMQNRTIFMYKDHEDVDLIQYKRPKRTMYIPPPPPHRPNYLKFMLTTRLPKVHPKLTTVNYDIVSNVPENSNKDSKKSNVPFEMCKTNNITCLPFCCPLRNRLVGNKCIREENKDFFLPFDVNMIDSVQSEIKRVDKFFQLAVYNSCLKNYYSFLNINNKYDYKIFKNGSIDLIYNISHTTVESTSYCFAAVKQNKFDVMICSSEIFKKIIDAINSIKTNKQLTDNKIFKATYMSFYIGSILFLVPIFVVYSLLSELRNIHGFMLCNYSGALSIACTIHIVTTIIKTNNIHNTVCLTIGFVECLCFMLGYFWLIMISFDMWWTFRRSCLSHKNDRTQKKKKLVFYIIFAWSCSFILTIVCVIVDPVSKMIDVKNVTSDNSDIMDVSNNSRHWFSEKEAFTYYFYGMKSVCVISSICFFISTALKIARYEKDTSFHLTDSESKRYNNNKRWFNLYLKLFTMLFIVMSLNWFMTAITWCTGEIKFDNIKYSLDMVEITQNFCMFVIFICKKKIKLMLLKRFGYQINVTSNSCTVMSEMSTQEEINSCEQEKCHAKDSSDDIQI